MNAADPHHFSFSDQLLPLAVDKQMGIIGMKVPGKGRLLSNWTPPSLEQQKAEMRTFPGAPLANGPGTLSIREAMYYTLSRPVSTVIIGCDSIAHVEENVRLAREFTPLSDQQQSELVAKAEPIAPQAMFFRLCERFDSQKSK